MDMELNLEMILDSIVSDIQNDDPSVSDFEASFSAIRLNLTILTQNLAMVGMSGEGLSQQSLYGICEGLVQTCQWMAAKEMAAAALRDIEREP